MCSLIWLNMNGTINRQYGFEDAPNALPIKGCLSDDPQADIAYRRMLSEKTLDSQLITS